MTEQQEEDRDRESEEGGAGEAAEERTEATQAEFEGDRPFDENPPVDPSEAQVGNSKARFFTPREASEEPGGDEAEDAEEGEDSGATESGERGTEGLGERRG